MTAMATCLIGCASDRFYMAMPGWLLGSDGLISLGDGADGQFFACSTLKYDNECSVKDSVSFVYVCVYCSPAV